MHAVLTTATHSRFINYFEKSQSLCIYRLTALLDLIVILQSLYIHVHV